VQHAIYELGKQLADILKKNKAVPTAGKKISTLRTLKVTHRNQRKRIALQYKVYQASFYPLNDKAIVFPSVGLENDQHSRWPRIHHSFGQNRQEDFKKFYSKAKTVKVKQLPPHPMRDAVAVGDYRLENDSTRPISRPVKA